MGVRDWKENFRQSDTVLLLKRCEDKCSHCWRNSRVGWARLRDACLSLGVAHTLGLKKLSKAMAHHGRGTHPCPLCGVSELDAGGLLDHTVSRHRVELHLDHDCNATHLVYRMNSINLSFLPKLFDLY